MFENLSNKLTKSIRNLSGRGRISESNVRESMEDVRRALLEADVHVDVVSDFCENVVQDALGADVTTSLKPGEEMIGIVNQRLIDIMGPVDSHIMLVEPGPTVIMMCGLQGSGKTTTCGKLAAYLKKQGKHVVLVAADLQRPAAVEQLEVVANDVQTNAKGTGQVTCYSEPDKCGEYGTATGVAVGVCKRGVKFAKKSNADIVILDTAGRLHIDDALMTELRGVQKTTTPHQVYLVVDAMIGQDAVTAAGTFHEQLAVDGVILTKFDSDTRGGAALSVKRVTGVPIKFIGTGERFDAFEEFHPDRIASRILGMGDVVSLVEKAQEEFSEEDAMKLADKMASGKMTVDDFMKQLKSIRRMGPMKQILGMIPGVGSALKNVQVDDKQFDRIEAIASSMTKKERSDIKLLGKSRIKRIAAGSGTNNSEVNKFVKQFEMMQKMSKQMSSGGMASQMAALQNGGMDPSAMGDLAGMGRGSTKTQSHKKRFKPRKRK
ncbi:MAG: signal recognition particle protein [Phycisphaerae bacterium]|jgi:signal recognition particle subunit SRP54|nr:signal recognition particle protein [Phycisphaerae bacterium]MBT6164752.1 signal recognition particle protein [Phycisphaerae bacterium]MBT7657886.1 signal recognition particle protein [Phycisphaerae bacterium]|tara:strand:+ start:477 stop:1949 length:1473 start_codon:yes stop_codon:yes gene_type:complete